MSAVFCKIHMRLKGTFHGEVIHGDGSRSYYPNMGNKIVNQGLDAIGGLKPAAFGAANLTTLCAGITVGTNNTAPSATDTALLGGLAFSTTGTGSQDTVTVSATAPYANTLNRVFQFAVGAVVGNIAEIGALLGTSASSYTAGSPVFSRALIQVGGSPGTITLTATDQLIVTYTLSYILVSDVSGNVPVNVDGTITNPSYTARPCNLGTGSGSSLTSNYNQPMSFWNQSGPSTFWWSNTAYVATTANGSPVGATANSATMGTYTSGTYTRSCNFHWNTGFTVAARTMINCAMSCMHFQVLIASPISVTTLQTLDVNVQMTWAAT